MVSLETYRMAYSREANKVASEAQIPQGLTILADLCERVSKPLKRSQAYSSGREDGSTQRNETPRPARAQKRKPQAAGGEKSYKSEFEWGYVPAKRRRGAASSPSPAQTDPLSEQGASPTTSNQQNTSASSPPQHSAQQFHSAGTQTLPFGPVQELQSKGTGSTSSARPASSGSDVTTLFCDEQLPDVLADTAEGIAPVTSPLTSLLKHQNPRAIPPSFLPSPSHKEMSGHDQDTDHLEQIPGDDISHARQAASSGMDTPTSAGPAAGRQDASRVLEPRMSSQDAALACAETLVGAANHSPHGSAGLPQEPREAAKDPSMDLNGSVIGAKDLQAGGDVSGPQCVFCLTRDTPQWRDGPDGPRTACNACSTAWQRARRPARPWLPGRVSRMLAAQAAAAASV